MPSYPGQIDTGIAVPGAPADAPFGTLALRNSLWNTVQFVVSTLTTLASSVVVARTLAPAGMGAYSYLMWVGGVAIVAGTLGLPEALLKYISEFLGSGDRGTALKIGRRLLAIQFFAGLAVSLAALGTGLLFLRSFDVAAVVLTAALVLPQSVLRSTNSILAGVHRYDLIALTTTAGGVAQVAFVSIAALLHRGVAGMLAATVGSALVAFVISFVAARRVFLAHLPAPRTAGDGAVFRRVRLFSGTLAYILLVDFIVWQRSEVFLLKRYLPLPEIAFYTIAFAITMKATQVSDTITGALLPVFSGSFGSHGAPRLAVPLQRAIRYVEMAMVPVAVGGVLLIGPVLRRVYGEGYAPAVPLGQIFMAGVIVSSLAGVGSSIVYATDRPLFIAKWGTITGIVKIGLTVAAIPRYGAMGAALSNMAAQTLAVAVTLRYAGETVGARFPWRAVAAILLATGLASTPAIIATALHAPLLVLVGLLLAAIPAYLAILNIFGEFGDYERLLLGRCWESAKVPLRRLERVRSFRYFVVELTTALFRDYHRYCEQEYRAQVDPLGYARASEQVRFRRALQMLDQVRAGNRFARVLEVGCAEGAFTHLLADRCDSLLGVDFAPTALSRAAERCAGRPALQFQLLDIRKSAVEGNFDLILAVGVLEYLLDPRDLRRVRETIIAALRPGGYLLVGNAVRGPVVENSSWMRWMPRGTRLNDFVAAHPQVRLIAEATDECALPFRHTLVQKI